MHFCFVVYVCKCHNMTLVRKQLLGAGRRADIYGCGHLCISFSYFTDEWIWCLVRYNVSLLSCIYTYTYTYYIYIYILQVCAWQQFYYLKFDVDTLTQIAKEKYYLNSLGEHLKDTSDTLELYKASQVIIHPNESALCKQNSWSSHFLKQKLSDNSVHSHRYAQYLFQEVILVSCGIQSILFT